MKSKTNVSNKIREYISNGKISTTQISMDTGILEDKLLDESYVFNADEFLSLCYYLNVRPEEMR